MDAITLLKRGPRKVKATAQQLEPTTERAVKTRESCSRRIKAELTVHEIIEEEIFYPTLKEHPRAKDIVLEGYEEHHVVDTLMGELEALPVDDETWGAKANVMIENIEHHIEEEEGDMFVKARQVFDAAELEQLGEAMAARKAEVTEPGPGLRQAGLSARAAGAGRAPPGGARYQDPRAPPGVAAPRRAAYRPEVARMGDTERSRPDASLGP